MTTQDRPQAARLERLRRRLAEQGLDGFVVPRADEHQGEYVPARAQRLAWLTGFTGSAGMAVVLADKAALFVDGRYTFQAAQQSDPALFEPCHLAERPPGEWIAENLPKGGRLGVDPWLASRQELERFRRAAERAGGSVVAVDENPLDAVWSDQPPPPGGAVVLQPPEFAGRSSAEKRREIGAALGRAGAEAAVLTLPDSINWLLNVRGSDLERTPFALSFAVLRQDGAVTWLIEPRKLSDAVRAELQDGVEVRPPADFGAVLDGLTGRRVLVDPASAPAWVFDRLGAAGATVVEGDDPCQLPKAAKNAVEQAGARNAHRRDGAALTRFLAWFAAEAPQGGLTELDCAAKLESVRREDNLLRDLSFDTIAGSGPNGALPHYRVTEDSNRRLQPGDLMVLDSGGQYLDGTTDVTRTLLVGEASPEARDRYTRVLQGHIALATTRFPKGTSGSQLDAIARRPLWPAGLDYDHGTGHGVGAYLSVHEGPVRLSRVSELPLEPGMVLSNEPGYYREGAFGIRIENLVAVEEAPPLEGADDREMLAFETLTWVPIDRHLIVAEMLSAGERDWLNAYHARVFAEIGPQLDGAEKAWLESATAPI